MLYHQRTPVELIITLDDVTKDDIPSILNDYNDCNFPKTFHKDDPNCQILLSFLLQTNQVQTKETFS